jgi:hypothetical protein
VGLFSRDGLSGATLGTIGQVYVDILAISNGVGDQTGGSVGTAAMGIVYFTIVDVLAKGELQDRWSERGVNVHKIAPHEVSPRTVTDVNPAGGWVENMSFWDKVKLYSGGAAGASGKALVGTSNAILGGLFNEKYGLPYQLSETVRSWSSEPGRAFKTGQSGYRIHNAVILIAAGRMAKSTSGPEHRWFRTHIVSVGKTQQGGNTITLFGKFKYVGTHAAKAGEAAHTRQIMWGDKAIKKW